MSITYSKDCITVEQKKAALSHKLLKLSQEAKEAGEAVEAAELEKQSIDREKIKAELEALLNVLDVNYNIIIS